MARTNRDIIAAVFLLVLTCVFYAATFTIRKTSFGTVGSEVWPRAILVAQGVLCILYLANALRGRYPMADARGGGIAGWFSTYRNAMICFAMYGLFLFTLPYLGMLIGSTLFVFLVFNFLGGWGVRRMAVHGAIAAVAMGAMWAVFTFGLRVILPEGEVLRIW
ncbi:MAG: tripartite tricarboxylate transporter TctB family protein [Alphaproteobacteria bacterium]|nr:tripartite tricarboxylate transporter TctB family protein [Alphaproteobacteria bacterium]